MLRRSHITEWNIKVKETSKSEVIGIDDIESIWTWLIFSHYTKRGGVAVDSAFAMNIEYLIDMLDSIAS